MTSIEQLTNWLNSDAPELVAAIVDDVQHHVNLVRKAGDSPYGYALLPGDYCTQLNPATLVAAFNRESDIAIEHANDLYYRYSVDEWQNYEHQSFDASNSQLRLFLERFKSAHTRSPDSCQLDEFEFAYIAKINRAFLDAMLKLKNFGTFDSDTFLIIWYSDTSSEIMSESARVLNAPAVYLQYASVFS